MKLQYIGPAKTVFIAATGDVVLNGGTVDIEDQRIAEGLLVQPDSWKKVTGAKAAKPEEGADDE